MTWFFLDNTQRLRTIWRFVLFGFGFLFVHIAISLVLAVGFVIYLVSADTAPSFAPPVPYSKVCRSYQSTSAISRTGPESEQINPHQQTLSLPRMFRCFSESERSHPESRSLYARHRHG